MPDTQTTNFQWTKPEVGGSDDTWGQKLNETLEAIDVKMKEVADSVATAVTAAIQDKIFPVGGTLITQKEGNPSTWLGFGTWVLDSVDRAIVGAGGSWTVGQQVGANSISLAAGNIPSHRHLNQPPAYYSEYAGEHQHGLTGQSNKLGSGGTGHLFQTGGSILAYVAAAGNHRHLNQPPNYWSDYAGSGTAFSIVQASEAFYIWRRTA